MNRNAYKIGKIYHLGRPTRRTNESMRKIIHFLDPGYGWYTFEYADCLPKRNLCKNFLIDHDDEFKHHLTLLPYVVGVDVENEIKQDPRWQLCIQCGLRYEIVDPDPVIFEKDWSCDYVKLIILSCNDWRKICTDIERELKRNYGH